jgi:hypothetical protein
VACRGDVPTGDHSMIDLYAPIVPGRSAAGISLELLGEVVLTQAPNFFQVELIENPYFPLSEWGTAYRSREVDLFIDKGVVAQVLVKAGYQGKIDGQIGIGMTIGELEACGYFVFENEEDGLGIWSLPGMGFEIAQDSFFSRRHENIDAWRSIELGAIFVFEDKDSIETQVRRETGPSPAELAESLRLPQGDDHQKFIADYSTLVYQYVLFETILNEELSRSITARVFRQALDEDVHDRLQGAFILQRLLQLGNALVMECHEEWQARNRSS